MNTSLSYKILGLTCFLFTFATLYSGAQEPSVILDAYEAYSKAPREVAYVHLNKSTYIKGEDIGFTAYILDKQKKVPSQLTTNLYVTIEDENKTVISKKLLKVKNGIASNVIELDSAFKAGDYTFKAYTNWMRNFDEQNYFIETITIIDPKNDEIIETALIENKIDAQFLPESGHLVHNVNTNIGVIIKDAKGYGIPNAEGKVYDKNQILVSEFKVNHLGIGRFPLIPKLGNTYKIKITHLNKSFGFDLVEKIEPIGISLSVVNYKNLAMVVLNTNAASLNYLADKSYKLTIHNGTKIDDVAIRFKAKKAIVRAFEVSDLPSGINVFTLFNDKNQPIAERLFFNYNGIKTTNSKSIVAQKQQDSITLKLNYERLSAEQLNNISVSVLPKETAAYKRHHSLLSYNFLQPYINGSIEQAKYYFTNINAKTKLDLDNLLITQGWSSYDWSKILGKSQNLFYPFEQGITIKANVNGENQNPIIPTCLIVVNKKSLHLLK
jgi:hypothetical protein